MFNVVQWSKPLLAAAFLLVCFQLSPASCAQQTPTLPAQQQAFADAPQPQQITDADNPQQAAILTGTVFDTNHDVLQGATITLAGSSGFSRTVQSGNDGQFAFSSLPPDVYKLTASAPGMSSFTASEVSVRVGETRIVPPITLSVSRVITSVNVTSSPEQVSEQQMHIALQQRVGGVIPNFYSTYDWNAPPMLAKQKIQLSIRSIFDPVAMLSVAGLAGAEQYKNIFPAYGSGMEGYGKRYGAAFANHASGIVLGRAVYPAIFHQDPRYFYRGKGRIRSRASYAIAAAVIARGDNGHWQPNYSRVLGNFSAAAISNLYYPVADRGASLVLLNGLASSGADAAANLIREFLLKRITSHVPPRENGEP